MSSTDQTKSISILRHFLRFALSSIVHHRIGGPSNVNASSSSQSLTLSSLPLPPVSSTAKACFTEKDYCGIKGLKFMDAVSDDGTIINMDGKSVSLRSSPSLSMLIQYAILILIHNVVFVCLSVIGIVYRISQWLEKGIFPALNQLHSFKFCILTTKTIATSQSSSSPSSMSSSTTMSAATAKRILETFHFQFLPHKNQETSPSSTSSNSNSSSAEEGLKRKSLMGQLRFALEEIGKYAEHGKGGDADTGTGSTSVSMNVILEFWNERGINSNTGVNAGAGVGSSDADADNSSGRIQPEFFTKSNDCNPLQELQQQQQQPDDGSEDNAIREFDNDDAHDHGLKKDSQELGDDGGDGGGDDGDRRQQHLGQSSQSQDPDQDQGRREIARVSLPWHEVVVSREYLLVDQDESSSHGEELGRLFPACNGIRPHAKVTATADGGGHQRNENSARERNETIQSDQKAKESSSARKRERDTPPLTPMRMIHPNHNKGVIVPSKRKSRYGSSISSGVDSSLHHDDDDQDHSPTKKLSFQERTPVNSRRGGRDFERTQSPMRSPLFVTPKNGSGKRRRSPASGSQSEAPTLIVPFSSGRKSSVGTGPLSSSRTTPPRPNKFQF